MLIRRSIYAFIPALALAVCCGLLSAAGQEQAGVQQSKAVTQVAAPRTEPGSSPEKPIQVQVNEVIIPVTVTDYQGRFVSDLDKNDFKILDEGQPQAIQFFSRERSQPVVIGFILDMSNASRLHWKHYQDAAVELALTLLPGSEKYSGFLISYSNEPELLVNTTSDSEPIVEKMRKLKPSGGAALYDAIYMALTEHKLVVGEPIEPRRVLVIIGDGHDNASKKTLNQVLELAQRDLVTIYGVSTVAFGDVTPDERNLVRLAEETGGRVVSPLQKVYSDVSGYLSTPMDEGNYKFKAGTGGYSAELAQGMFRAITDIAGEITTQYILRYVPQNVDGKKQFRKVEVVVSLPNMKVRARKGYYPYTP